MDSIVLTTANAKTSEAHRLKLELSSILRLKDSLVSLSHLSLYYTWNNFEDKYGNTEFTYTHVPSGTNNQVNIPAGSYGVEDLNNFIHMQMTNRKHENADGTFGINLYANTHTIESQFKFQLILYLE